MTFVRREVGRVMELVQERHRQGALFVDVVGEVGSGRTGVLRELQPRLEETGWITLRAQGYPGRGSSARTLPDLVAQLTEGVAPRTRELLETTVREALRRSRRADALFTDLTLTGTTPSLVPVMEERIGGMPLAILIDDGHLAEPLFWRFLWRLLSSAPAFPWIVVGTSDGSRDAPLGLPKRARVQRVGLQPLSVDELAELLASLDVPEPLARAGATALHDDWHRSPKAAGYLAEDARAGDLTSPADAPALVSRGMKGFHMRRIARLSEAERGLLEIASVTVSGINFWRLDRLGVTDKVEASLATDALEAKGFLRRTYPGGRLRLIFQEPEERLLLYGSLDEEKRRLLHGRFARVVEEDDLDPEDRFAEVGRHLVLSGDELSGAAKLLDAGRQLLRRGRVDEARRHFEEVARRGRSQRALRMERVLALEGLADVEVRRGSVERAGKEYEGALTEGEGILSVEDHVRILGKLSGAKVSEGRLDDADRLLEEALRRCPETLPALRATIFERQARASVRRGDLVGASAAIQRALTTAIRTRDDDVMAHIHRTTGSIRQERGEIHQAISDFEAAREIYERLEDAHGFGSSCNSLGTAYSSLGKTEEAIAFYKASLRIHEGLGDLSGVTMSLNNLATLQMNARKLDEAEASLKECLRLQKRLGRPEPIVIAQVNLAAIALDRRQYARALEIGNETIAGAEATGSPSLRIAVLVTRISALTALGRLADALQLLAEGAELSRLTGNAQWSAWMELTGARTKLVLGDLDAAEEELTRALRLSQEHEFRDQEIGCLETRIEIEIERGAYDLARQHLAARRRSGERSALDRGQLDSLEVDIELRELGLSRPHPELEPRLLAIDPMDDPELAAKRSMLLAQALPPEQALAHAQDAYAAYAQMGLRELLARAALRLGQVERALGRAEAPSHLDEAARTFLSIAAELSEEQREIYLRAYGRRKALLHARRLE